MSKTNRPPVSVRKIVDYMTNKKENQIAVVVGTVTDDKRQLDLPKVTVCALRFTKTARARITKAGGACLTFDQLAIQRPKGANCLLIRGSKNTREAVKHFGTPGAKHSHAKYALLIFILSLYVYILIFIFIDHISLLKEESSDVPIEERDKLLMLLVPTQDYNKHIKKFDCCFSLNNLYCLLSLRSANIKAQKREFYKNTCFFLLVIIYRNK